MKKRRFLLPLLLGLTLLTLSACATKSQPEHKNTTAITTTATEDTKFLMGTVCTIKVYNKHKQQAVKDGFARIKELAKKITVNQKGSEIDKVNKYAGVKPVKASRDIYRLCKEAYHYSANSDESFDMAIGPITQLWRIGFPDAHVPKQSQITKRLKLVNYRNVQFDDVKQTVYLTKKGMQLDLGGIAKGFITDEVKKVLRKDGVTSAIIDLGGNVYVLGESPTNHSTWTVGVQDPKRSRGVAIGSMPEKNKSIVTSGIYERYLKVGKKTYSHLMDPKTGYPFQNNLMGVTIVSSRSTDGDALSTATFDKGLKDGYAYIEKKKRVDAIFITKDKKVYVTSGLQKKFKLFKDSGYKLASIKSVE
ncbi:FAD:protein FMN transferase [Lactobacillus corticis]|uniref:FAD:protein FMN transferase n=1 Tax=Lactobacillus corticis TaxID=2201249 RepID=A0A916QHY7_9LACO|nr:FAD:protein FMN transferase [Lactobacillus corticis]GFZ27279.1 thiamine biosynthesis lipoprotein [Lactobacillus corticis]